MPRSKYNPFKTPPVNYDYGPVVDALALCRERVTLLIRECGDRLPMRREAEAVIHDIDALAKLLPEGAADQVIPNQQLHSTPPQIRRS